MHSIRLLLLSIFLFFSSLLSAEATVYQYFDDEGTLIVTDDPYGTKQRKPFPRQLARDLQLAFRDDVAYDYYLVNGSTLADIMADVHSQGMRRSGDGRSFAGQTRWSLGWSYSFDYSSRIERGQVIAAITITNVEFRSDISVLLPKIPDGRVLEGIAWAHWAHFLQGLLEHEHDHVRIVRHERYRDEALALLRKISTVSLPYAAGMNIDAAVRSAVEEETARVGHAMIRTVKEKNEEYDRLTEHGLKPWLRQSFLMKEGIRSD